MEGSGRRRDVRRPPLGQGLFRHQQGGPRHRPSEQAGRPVDRPQGSRSTSCRPAASSCRSCCASPTSSATASARSTTPSRTAITRVRLPGQLLLRLPDQGQPAAARRRGDPRLRQAVPLRSRGRLQARAAGRAGPDQRPGHADHLQRLQGRRIHQDDHARPQDRQADHPGRREVHRAGADRPPRRRAERPADDRRARQAGGARGRPLAVAAPATVPSSA